jgi:transcription-repair coupling factor (superfamily II helicase)
MDAIAQEIKDRFGHFPEPFETFIEILKLKQKIKPLGIVKVDVYANKLAFTWHATDSPVNPLDLVQWVNAHQDIARLVPPGKLELRWQDNQSIALCMHAVNLVVDGLVDELMPQNTDV